MQGTDHPSPVRRDDADRPLATGRDEKFHKLAGKGNADTNYSFVKVTAKTLLRDLDIEAGIRLRVGAPLGWPNVAGGCGSLRTAVGVRIRS